MAHPIQPVPTREPAGVFTAAQLLGEDHPLARASREVRRVATQAGATATFVAGAIALAILRGQGAAAIVTAALLVAPVLFVKVIAAIDVRRTLARDAIIAGLEDVPARELRGPRRRLARAAHRQQLVAELRRLGEYADAGRAGSAEEREPDDVRALFQTVADDLDQLDGTRVRGVAACELDVANGVLVRLTLADRESLRRELRRLHYLLTAQ